MKHGGIGHVRVRLLRIFGRSSTAIHVPLSSGHLRHGLIDSRRIQALLVVSRNNFVLLVGLRGDSKHMRETIVRGVHVERLIVVGWSSVVVLVALRWDSRH